MLNTKFPGGGWNRKEQGTKGVCSKGGQSQPGWQDAFSPAAETKAHFSGDGK